MGHKAVVKHNHHTDYSQPLSLETQLTAYQMLYDQLNISDSFYSFVQLIHYTIPCDGIFYHHHDYHLSYTQGVMKKYHYCVPLKHSNQSIGELTFSHDTPFSQGIQQELDILSSLWLRPLYHALQYHHALQTTLQDHLTKTGNRAAYDRALEQEINYAKRHDSPLTMLLIDIDHFKHINDQYGHHQGDRILQQFAQQLKELVRDSDMVFRYGGEEFIVLLRNTDLQGANLLAKRICEAVYQSTVFKINESLSVSIGSCELDHYDSLQQFFQRADKALYHAKQQGRNCVANYHALDSEPTLIDTET